jgi:hypothetical protein
MVTDSYDFMRPSQPADMLVHAEMYSLGITYDIDQLRNQAHLEVLSYLPATNNGGPHPLPSNFFAAIRFIYGQEAHTPCLKDQVIAYCLSHFRANLLAHPAFKELVLDIPQLVTDLCRENFNRGFQDDCEFL